MENNRYAVDRIEGCIAVLENIVTGEILEIDKIDGISEGDILIKSGDTFIKDDTTREARVESIREKMAKLKGND